ncbi:MAG: CAP domain-containing protein, partial [Clostridia bacterium]|nr:CAP domain-containing protein [Clostridia bacterium]
RTAGENIAKGYKTPAEVMQGRMNSPGHRANILNGSFRELGVGYVKNGNYWTQEFIG